MILSHPKVLQLNKKLVKNVETKMKEMRKMMELEKTDWTFNLGIMYAVSIMLCLHRYSAYGWCGAVV